MDTLELFQRLGVALAIGLLVGVERGWRERERKGGSRTAGIRTHALIGLLGGIMGALVPAAGPLPLALVGLAVAVIFAAYKWRESAAHHDYSVTSVIAAVATFAIGAYAAIGNIAAAAAAGVAAVALLAARQGLHEFLRRLTWAELRSAIVLLAMTFLLLPILPDRFVDPWDALNPHRLWLMVVLIALVSFAGYAAVRISGERRGLILASAASGLVSSTAVTFNNARLARSARGEPNSLTAGTAVAWTVSLFRMVFVAAVVDRALFVPLGLPVLAAAAVLGLVAVRYDRRAVRSQMQDGLALRNPFELRVVLAFGAVLTAVILAAKVLSDRLGEAGLFVLAAVTGAADVDAMTLSAAQLAGSAVAVNVAAVAILIAGASNLLVKCAISLAVGRPGYGVPLAVAGMAALAAGAAVFWVLYLGVL